jgi:hypothetical protein
MRLDFIFSYWILLWYLAYAIKFTDISPKFALVFGLIENLIMFSYIAYLGTPIGTLMRFGIANTAIKIIPLYLLRREPIRRSDIIMTLVIFGLYNAWLFLHGETFYRVVSKITDSLVHNKNETPFMKLLARLERATNYNW